MVSVFCFKGHGMGMIYKKTVARLGNFFRTFTLLKIGA